ncbi:MAG: response regulator transcription factor [Sphingomonadales bacterium]|nr:response regulator transcription factor [Sphingomonadales bacterium]MBM3923891.1 response regulator transcription factor [Sphingomonadales bacterium]
MSAYQGAPKVAKILVVDDEPDILEIISYNLRKEGYEVKTAENGLEAVACAKEFLPDMILLDVMMPKMDGMEACKQIRAIPSLKHCFILFLTAREEEFVEVLSFQAGADDFLTKPIKPRALISRIEAVFRRSKEDAKIEQTKQIKLGNLVIDRESYQVTQDGTVVVLARKEFELLFLLASRPGKVFTRDQILETIWGTDVVVINRTIDVHIRKLREKLGDAYITTIKGVGYKFELN